MDRIHIKKADKNVMRYDVEGEHVRVDRHDQAVADA